MTSHGFQKGPVGIAVDQDTNHPNKAWDRLKVKQVVTKLTPHDPNTPIRDDAVRFVCLSDTHAKAECLTVPPGDVLLHAGDFTNVGAAHEVSKFNDFLGSLPHRYKVVIAGNHDMSFDLQMVKNNRTRLLEMHGLSHSHLEDYLQQCGKKTVAELLTHCIYLEDTMVDVFGIKIYGSPWVVVRFLELCDWGFNLPRGVECIEKWDKIPEGVDVLMTHGPPVGYGDLCYDEYHGGCVELLNTIQKRVKPKIHVFGHIHEAYGATTDGFTTFINASNCTLRYKCTNLPIVFDLPLPIGHSKQEVLDTTPYDPSVAMAMSAD